MAEKQSLEWLRDWRTGTLDELCRRGLLLSEAADDRSLRAIFQLVWRCWPYYRPQLKHLITIVALNSLIGIVYFGGIVVVTDLVENKILLGNKLEPVQATLLFVDDGYVTSGIEGEPLLTDEQRKRVRLGILAAAATFWIILTAYTTAVWYYMVWTFQRINQQLRVEMLSRAEYLSLRYHNDTRTGDAIYRIYQDSATITHTLQYFILSPVRVIAISLFAAAVLTMLSLWFTVILLVSAAAIVGLTRRLTPTIRAKARLSRELNSDLTSRIQENLTAMRVIKANGAEQLMMSRFDHDSQGALEAAFQFRKYMSFLMLGVILIGFTGFAVAEYFMATWSVIEKATYMGASVSMVGFVVWNLGAYKYATAQSEQSALNAWEWASLWCFIQDLSVGLQRAFYLLDLEPEVTDPLDPKPFPDSVEEINFSSVAFGYKPEKPVLSGVNLTARKGSITAIVGGTGVGKSTLMSLAIRLYDPDSGTVKINGRSLRDFAVSDVRVNVAIALQQNTLFAQSVTDNLRYGQDAIDDKAIESAARIACAHEFILELPMGYATELGEKGGKLSTGQRQRLSIARAVLRDSAILILDEPTAALDAETEQRVIANLAEWGKDKIVFIITHRLSTIRNADQIAFLDDGKLKEIGTHDELMSKTGDYAKFVNAELGDAHG